MTLSTPASPLKEVQRQLYGLLTDPRGARAAAAARRAAVALIREAPPIDRETRLSVYGDGYFLRLLEALTEDFKAVRRCVGPSEFRALCAGFIAANPSTSPSLADLGEKFPGFVASHRLAERCAYLADLAALERAVVVGLLSPRGAALDPSSLSKLAPQDWARARLRFDPTVRLLDLRWPVVALWREREENRRRAPRLRRARPRTVLLHRDEIWIRVRETPKAEAALLRRALSGDALGKLFSDDCAAGPEEVNRWFGGWMSAGLISGAEIAGRS